MLLLDLLPGCDNSQVLRIIYFIKELFHVLFILIPILLIIILSVDMAKNVMATKEEDMKKNVTIFLKRLLFCIAMFLIEPIVGFVINLTGDGNMGFTTCLQQATKETILDLAKVEDEAAKVAEEQGKSAQEQGVKDFLDSLEQNDKSENNTTGNYTGSNNSNKETKTYGNSTDKPIKVLLIGNSLTFRNGYGQILARMAKKTNKKIVVAMATIGGDPGRGKNLLRNKLNYVCWSSASNKCSDQKGTKKLEDVVKIDFAHLNRKSWDYIILQNHVDKDDQYKNGYGGIYESDIAIYNVVKNYLTTNKNFVINLTTFAKGVRPGRVPYHRRALKKIGGSLVYTAKIFTNYGKSWKHELTIEDSAAHQSVKGAYLFACIIYSKIYGPSNLAKNNNDSHFIEVYGDYAVSYYQRKSGNKKYGAMKVSKSDAKRLQALTYKYYKKYVLYIT